jgi:hypothetical protein
MNHECEYFSWSYGNILGESIMIIRKKNGERCDEALFHIMFNGVPRAFCKYHESVIRHLNIMQKSHYIDAEAYDVYKVMES